MPYLVNPVVPSHALLGRMQPEIRSEGLVLRPWRREDADQLVEAFQDELIQKWNLWRFDSVAEARDWIDDWTRRWTRHTGASWAVTLAGAEDVVLGQVAFRSLWLDDGLAELSCWIRPACRRYYLAANATQALAEWALRDLRLHRLEIVHSVENPAACKAAKRAGFEPEGIRRQLQRYADGFHDMCQHSMISADMPAVASFAAATADIFSRASRVAVGEELVTSR